MIIFLINHSSKNINGNRVWRRCWREDRRAHGSISFSLLSLNHGCRFISEPSPDIRELPFQRKTWPLFSVQVFLVCSGGASYKSFLTSLFPHAHPTTCPSLHLTMQDTQDTQLFDIQLQGIQLLKCLSSKRTLSCLKNLLGHSQISRCLALII